MYEAYRREKLNPTGYQQLPTASEHINHIISWGQPAKIAEAKESKHCSHCNIGQMDGFQLGIDEDGEIFGAWCPCGWTF